MSISAPELERIDQALKAAPDQHVDFLAQKEKIARILELREQKNALILGHNYMAPLVYQLSGEKGRGDSLALSRYASECENPIILFDGVRFMAETAKILSPEKTVLIADLDAGCSLADPFTAADIRAYRQRYPGVPVVTYVNSYADVKAESDYCCTSANGLEVVVHASREFRTDRVLFFPDSFMGANLQKELEPQGIDVIYPGKNDDNFGRCEVHEKFTPQHIREIRAQYDIPRDSAEAAVLVHWECAPEVIAEADYCGSTSQMAKYIAEHPGLKRLYLATECEMSANLAAEYPNIEFVRTCNIFCEHMRKITLDKILYSLEHDVHEVTVDEEVAKRARVAIERMLEVR